MFARLRGRARGASFNSNRGKSPDDPHGRSRRGGGVVVFALCVCSGLRSMLGPPQIAGGERSAMLKQVFSSILLSVQADAPPLSA